MNYRPICDTWILARSKVKYYGAYPAGFLDRARALLGVSINDPVLHVCSGMVVDYPFRGFGPNDKTLDIDGRLAPDHVLDVNEKPLPKGYAGILADPPYTEQDAERYRAGSGSFPKAGFLLARCIEALEVGRRVGILSYEWPRPPANARSVAVVGILVGFANRMRCFSVFERTA